MALSVLKPLPYPRVRVTLGDHVKKRRMELGFKQGDTARDLGVSVSTLIAWETNRATPGVRFLPRIIAYFGYDPYPEPQTIEEQIVAKRRRLGLA
jgi:transcriptional regulator with XRE-family HTH domain